MALSERRLRKLEHRVDELEETLDIMADKKLLKSIQSGLSDYKKGRYKKYKDVETMFSDLKEA
ncbi:MAG: hypothetical protein JRN52_07870 [Nitrososphaerota archaeon]|nr:hypothetical protein [Nitrososphaerota archaeon]